MSKKTTLDFDKQVCKQLRVKWQSSGEIAAALGLTIYDKAKRKQVPTNYGTAKVRDALKRLAEAGQAKHTGAFKTSRYAKA